MIKGIIFDMDGVIIDSEIIHYEVFRDVSRKHGIESSFEDYNKYVGSTDEAIYSAFKEKYNLKEDLDYLIKEHQDRFMEILDMKKDIQPIKGVKELIIEFHNRGYKLALASSAPYMNIDKVLDLFNIETYFDIRISGEDLEQGKPHPGIFLNAAKFLKLNPKECLVIEDSKNGVLAAKRAGMKCLGYRNENSGEQDISKADLIIDDFSTLDISSII